MNGFVLLKLDLPSSLRSALPDLLPTILNDVSTCQFAPRTSLMNIIKRVVEAWPRFAYKLSMGRPYGPLAGGSAPGRGPSVDPTEALS